jgi:hypothetical protein
MSGKRCDYRYILSFRTAPLFKTPHSLLADEVTRCAFPLVDVAGTP